MTSAARRVCLLVLIAILSGVAPALLAAQPYGGGYGPQGPPGPPPYAPYPPPPPPVERRGFTLGLGLGVGSLELHDESSTSDSFDSVFFELHMGGMLSPRSALLIEFWGSSHSDGDEQELSQGNFGIAFQFWTSRRFWLKAGLGSSRLRLEEFGSEVGSAEGWAVLGALGYELVHHPRYALDLQLRVTGASYEDDFGTDLGAVSGALALGFSWF